MGALAGPEAAALGAVQVDGIKTVKVVEAPRAVHVAGRRGARAGDEEPHARHQPGEDQEQEKHLTRRETGNEDDPAPLSTGQSQERQLDHQKDERAHADHGKPLPLPAPLGGK
jgi:hypothetical protein